jgi:N,N'-diacetyllegionaminate synthase
MKKCWVIAEAGVNHNGSLELAKDLICAAKKAGADAVKFQTFLPEKLASKVAQKAEYQKRDGTDDSQVSMLSKFVLNKKDHQDLMGFCKEQDIVFFSSPFDEESADLLGNLGVDLFKIGSGEITNLPLLKHVAQKGKPMIISTGMSSLGEVETAVRLINGEGCSQLTLLHCTSNYPANPENCNLKAIQTLKQAFGLPVGYSDHTMGIEISLAAVALGAEVIEKHLTLDQKLSGPDHEASLNPEEFELLVKGIRKIELSMGDGIKEMTLSEAPIRDIVRKSLVAACDLTAGSLLLESQISIKRPGTGLPPAQKALMIGRKLKKDLKNDDLLLWDHIE